MDNASNVKVVSVVATPVGATSVQEATLEETIQQTAQVMNDVMNGFSDEVPGAEPEEAKKARGFLKDFMNYVSSDTFKNDINDTAKKYKVPPKKLAQGFFEKALGVVGDILGIAISTVGNAGHTLVTLLASIIHGAINVVVDVANGLARMVTLNRTCIA